MPTLLHDLKRRPLPMPGGRTRQQSANRLDRLAVATNDPADIGLPQLDPEDRRFSRGDLRKHHLVRKLDKLANDKFEELFHRPEFIRSYGVVTSGLGAINGASDRSTRLLPAVGCDKILRVFADGADLLAIRTEEPIPIVRAAADEIAMLLHKETILVLSCPRDLHIIP